MPRTSLPPTWKRLAEAAGGVAKLAEHLGVTPRTIHRYAHGTSPISRPVAILLSHIPGGLKVLPGE